MTTVVIGTQAEASHGNTKGVPTMFPERAKRTQLAPFMSAQRRIVPV
jgi:hypothetical protein